MVEGDHFYGGYSLPLIKGKFANYENVLLVNHLAHILDVTTTSITQVINNNIEKFNQQTDIQNIAQLLINDKTLRESMKLTGYQVNRRINYIYILSKEGFYKLQELLLKNNSRRWNIEFKIIKDYFEVMPNSNITSGKINTENRYISPTHIKDLLAYKKYNTSYARYTINLKTANKKVFHNFKRNSIEPYIERVNKDLIDYLLRELKVNDLNHIPMAYAIPVKELIKDCYIVSDNLKIEYKKISKDLDLLYDTEALKNENNAKKKYKEWVNSFKSFLAGHKKGE